MRNDKHIALKLRKEGKSYKKISAELDIPKSTLSEWFSGKSWSTEIKNELARKANFISGKRLDRYNIERKVLREKQREKARQDAKKEFIELSTNPLFIAGIMLYWGEGDSKLENGLVRLSNTNPNIMRIFTLFLIKICKIPTERIKSWVLLYHDLNEKKCLEFWSNATGLQLSQFTKPTYIQGRHPTKRLSYGICQVTCTNRLAKEKIAVWIDLFQAQEKFKLHNLPKSLLSIKK